jgi:hypothetical protein
MYSYNAIEKTAAKLALVSASHFAYSSRFVCPSKHTLPTSLKILAMGRKNSSAGRENSSAVMIAYHGKGSKTAFCGNERNPTPTKKQTGLE